MRVAVLGSGSAGNSVVVERGRERLLIDAGFSAREIGRRLRQLEIAPESLGGIVLTHEHSDHSRGAELLARRHGLPVWASRGTLEGCRFQSPSGLRMIPVAPRTRFVACGFEVETFPVDHDAREPIGLVVEDADGHRLGLLCDLGRSSAESRARLRRCDILVQESNHDLEMLRRGPYTRALKERVSGDRGHLSNEQAAGSLEGSLCDELRWVVLYHLSKINNRPSLARGEAARTLERGGSTAAIVVAEQARVSPWMEV